MLRSCKRVGVTSLLLTLATSPAAAATITVNSNADTAADDGVCTLREAITAANNNTVSGGAAGECAAGDTGTDTIAFNIPATDTGCVGGPPKICTIAPTTPLPDITAPVLIDGYTQIGASANTLPIGDNAVILIRLDTSALSGATALHLAGGSAGSTVSGLSIVRPGGANNLGYLMKLDSNNVTVTGNFVGVEPDGHTVSTNNITFYPLWLLGTGHTVGGTTPGLRNLIASTNGAPLQIDNGGTHLIQGNYIDLDATGTVAIGSAGSGIVVEGGGGSTIGGGVAGAGNVVGTWTFGGGLNLGLSGFHPGLLTAQGNLIGTDATGKVALAAGPSGIAIVGGGGTYKIGGSGAGEGNVIGGAQTCISANADTTGAGTPLIQGNHIGISLDGMWPLPCGSSGISVSGPGGGLIGGTAAGDGNVIAYNGSSAISFGAGVTNWAMLGNSIYGNGFGISLSGSGVPTPNDTNDTDTGPNNLQNYPAIGSVTMASKIAVQVSGTLNSEASTAYRLEFFANAGCDGSGHGQGKDFIGSADVTTNATNDASFSSLPFTVPADRHVITATATDPNGNTSEFSLCSDQDTIFTDSFEGD